VVVDNNPCLAAVDNNPCPVEVDNNPYSVEADNIEVSVAKNEVDNVRNSEQAVDNKHPIDMELIDKSRERENSIPGPF
jgi:hypothetical protein